MPLAMLHTFAAAAKLRRLKTKLCASRLRSVAHQVS
jgi:hypothetical protein